MIKILFYVSEIAFFGLLGLFIFLITTSVFEGKAKETFIDKKLLPAVGISLCCYMLLIVLNVLI